MESPVKGQVVLLARRSTFPRTPIQERKVKGPVAEQVREAPGHVQSDRDNGQLSPEAANDVLLQARWSTWMSGSKPSIFNVFDLDSR